MQQFRRMARLLSRGGAAAAFVLCLLGCFAPGTARADVKIVSHISMDSPAMQNLPAQDKAQLESLFQFTIYVSGTKLFISNSRLSVLMDPANKRMDMIHTSSKTYSEIPFDPATAQMMMPGNIATGTSMKDYNVVDTGETQTYLGHKVRHYVVTATMSSGQMGIMNVKSDILAAQDLPAADIAGYDAMSAAMPGKTHIVGIPLKTVTTVTGGPMGARTLTQDTASITTDPIPASTFAIPDGYTKSDQPAMPGMPRPGLAPPPAQ